MGISPTTTCVPAVHDEVMGKEARMFVVEPIFNSSLELIIIGKMPSLQILLQYIEDVVFTWREIRSVWGDPIGHCRDLVTGVSSVLTLVSLKIRQIEELLLVKYVEAEVLPFDMVW
ncbi:hypothetical protein TNCV_942521 [Trichonephila clavipes]|nr:hypothetical protein TNCV_942521 [Trichonephila clavipes]